MKNSIPSFLYVAVIFSIISFFFVGDFYATTLNTPHLGYRFSYTQISDITLADGSCIKVTNNNTDRFIPTKTMAEWLSFSSVASFLGISIESCIVPTCSDGIKNGTETGVDCGGTCPACAPTYSWQTGSYGACSASCGPGIKFRSVWCERNDGVGVSDGFCGGGKPSSSVGCNDGACPPTCTDGIQNQSETEVDCGGPNCSPCSTTDSCTKPWGGTIAHGASITAYSNSSPGCGVSCSSETRTCNDGNLSGSFTAQSCTTISCHWERTIDNSVTTNRCCRESDGASPSIWGVLTNGMTCGPSGYEGYTTYCAHDYNGDTDDCPGMGTDGPSHGGTPWEPTYRYTCVRN